MESSLHVCTVLNIFQRWLELQNNDFFFLFSDKESNAQRLSIVKDLDQVWDSIKKKLVTYSEKLITVFIQKKITIKQKY